MGRVTFPENVLAVVYIFDTFGSDSPDRHQFLGGTSLTRTELTTVLPIERSKTSGIEWIDFALALTSDPSIIIEGKLPGDRNWTELATVTPRKGFDVITDPDQLVNGPRMQITFGNPDDVAMETLQVYLAGRTLKARRINV